VTKLDHIIIAAPDLEAVKDQFFNQTGIMPVDGGSHANAGTCNALVAFTEGQYLEFIAPDPLQDIAGTRAERFAALAEPIVLHWAVSCTGLTETAAAAKSCGLVTSGILPMQRTTPAGTLLEWELCFVSGHNQAGAMPFFIDWLDSQHPSQTSPIAGSLCNFVVSAPKDSAITHFPRPFPEYAVQADGPLAIRFEINSPKGLIKYEQSNPIGFG
jgi:hypothetical protein